MEQTLDHLIKESGGSDSLYAAKKGEDVSLADIKANTWMLTVDFCYLVPLDPEDPVSSDEDWDPLEAITVGPATEPDTSIL